MGYFYLIPLFAKIIFSIKLNFLNDNGSEQPLKNARKKCK